ncbi:MAG: hypothetical protein AAF656_00415 [Planctomycetota bacterium]
MSVTLGPNVIRHGINPDRGLIVSGDCAMLGPAVGPSSEVDPISRVFVLLGKILHTRRVIAGKADGQPAAVEQLGALQHVMLDYGSDARDEGRRDEWEVVWQPMADAVKQQVIESARSFEQDLKTRATHLLVHETKGILALDPTASLEERVASLRAYLLHNGYTVEAASDGFADFLGLNFRDPKGRPIQLPTSADPSFPDKWITPEQVDPAAHGGSRREWNLIL